MIDEFLESGTLFSLSPDKVLIGYGPKVEANADTVSFYFPDFFLSKDVTPFSHTHWIECSPDELLTALPKNKSRIDWKEAPFEPFHQAFNDAQSLIRKGNLIKAVPFVFAQSDDRLSKRNLAAYIYALLINAKKQPITAYGTWDGGAGILGGTPELLFKRERDRLETVALAGTRSDQASDEAFLQDPKERSEHQVVIDGIKESLAPLGEISVGTTEVIHLRSLAHLSTPISLSLKGNASFDQIVQALHPTPALGAWPKDQGSLWLKRYQTLCDRGRFGAPAGYIYGRKAACYVAIRNIQFDQTGIRMGAGCGVVKNSELQREWGEIERKLKAIRGLFDC